MKILLDTHILIWALCAVERLPDEAFKLLSDSTNELYCSSASIWESAIKHAKAPEKIPVSADELAAFCQEAGFYPLSVTHAHALTVPTLHRAEDSPPHHDPFDRILIAQAKHEQMLLLTHDHLLTGYQEPCIKYV